MGASVVVGALCVSHSDLAKYNRYVVKIILHLKRSLGRRPRERLLITGSTSAKHSNQFDALPRFVLHFKLKKNSLGILSNGKKQLEQF